MGRSKKVVHLEDKNGNETCTGHAGYCDLFATDPGEFMVFSKKTKNLSKVTCPKCRAKVERN